MFAVMSSRQTSNIVLHCIHLKAGSLLLGQEVVLLLLCCCATVILVRAVRFTANPQATGLNSTVDPKPGPDPGPCYLSTCKGFAGRVLPWTWKWLGEVQRSHADQETLRHLIQQYANLLITIHECPPEELTAAIRLFTVSSALCSEIFRSS